MRSRITIEMDLDVTHAPVIKIVSKVSDDVRDKLVRHLWERLGYDSAWFKIQFNHSYDDVESMGDMVKVIQLSPITPQQLIEEATKMMQSATTAETVKASEQEDLAF